VQLVRLTVVLVSPCEDADIASLAAGEGSDESKEADGGKKKVSVNAVRVNNNGLPDLVGLGSALAKHVRATSEVKWIDASFNKLTSINESVRSSQRPFVSSVL